MTDTVHVSQSLVERPAAVTLHESLREFTKTETVEYIWGINSKAASAVAEEGTDGYRSGSGNEAKADQADTAVVGDANSSNHHEDNTNTMSERDEVLIGKDDLTRSTVEAISTLLDSYANIDADCSTSDINSNRNSIVKEAATTARVSAAFPQKDSASKISHTALPSATKSKTKTTKTSYASKLPEHLFLHLKRFEFSYSAMRQVRICIIVV
jgi:hypothetical protein